MPSDPLWSARPRPDGSVLRAERRIHPVASQPTSEDYTESDNLRQRLLEGIRRDFLTLAERGAKFPEFTAMLREHLDSTASRESSRQA